MSFECNYTQDEKSPRTAPDIKAVTDITLPNSDHICVLSSAFESYDIRDTDSEEIFNPPSVVKFPRNSVARQEELPSILTPELPSIIDGEIEEAEISEHEGDIASVLDDLQFGIKVSLEENLPKYPKRDLLMTDFSMIEVFNVNQRESSGARHNFTLHVYAPIAFRFFRELFDITTEDFKKSVCQEPLYNSNSSGNSGCKFYTSRDDRFILKTVQKQEAKFLINLFPGYFLNLAQHTKTLLPKYYGLFCYQKGTTKIRILIMNNILPINVKIHEKYDLKGSTYSKRKYTGELSKTEVNLSITLKDLDFIERWPNGFYMHHTVYEILLNSIERDCKVLESYNIMDYSLLLGVAINNGDADMKISRSKFSESFRKNKNLIGPFAARTMKGSVVYIYLGIIDILQSYGWKKKVESFVKSLVYRRNSVSVTRPDLYSRRFLSFLKSSVFKCIPKLVSSTKNECCTKNEELEKTCH